MFPTINHIDDLLPHIENNPQIRVKVEPNGYTVVCYMLQDEDTFSGANAEFAAECRGITFRPDGKVAARTLHKFFNVGQEDSTRPENIDWHRVVRIMDKRDGSMVTPVLTPGGGAVFKTKKTFSSKEAEAATILLHDVSNDQVELEWVKAVMRAGLTPTFEFTSPKFPIVLLYEQEELTLLHVRENNTGRYLSEDELNMLNPPFRIVENVIEQFSWVMADAGIPTTYEVRWDLLKKAAETREGVEGWVIQFVNGDMVKLKTQWYCDLHHSVTFTRWRDIARSVVADQSDDLKAAFAMTGRSIEPILQVERNIKRLIEHASARAWTQVEEGRSKSFTVKDMALALNKHELFNQIMRMFRGGEVNWMEWYEKNHLDTDWSLEVVVEQE